MKMQMFSIWALGVLLVTAQIPEAAAQQTLKPSDASQSTLPAADSKLTTIDLSGPLIIQDPKVKSPASGGYVSSWVAEIEKLARAGVDDSVMLTFVDSAGTFNLSADQIIELRDLGVCTPVITAMIDHDTDLLSGLRPMPTSAVAASPPQINFAIGPDVRVTIPPAPANADLASIVVRDQQESAVMYEPDGGWQTGIRQREAPAAQPGISPVRTPYPVKLTDPIVVFRGAGRTPNILVVNMLP